MKWSRLLLVLAVMTADGADRPKMPQISRPVMFNTREADAILASLQVFPADNPWNEDISMLPVHPASQQMIASMGADKKLAYNLDMSFILVPPDQKKLPVKLIMYPDESDPGRTLLNRRSVKVLLDICGCVQPHAWQDPVFMACGKPYLLGRPVTEVVRATFVDGLPSWPLPFVGRNLRDAAAYDLPLVKGGKLSCEFK
jgi:hypothetical protein